MSLLTMRQYAIHRGVSINAVSKAVKQGRISCARDSNGYAMIDAVVADREWAANTGHSKMYGNGEAAPQRPHPQQPPAPEPEAPRGGPSYAQSRAVREAYQARLAKLDYEEQTGKLINADEVKERWLHIAGLVRTKVSGIPSKAKQRISDLTTEHYLELETIVREALEDLADGDG